MLLPRSASTRPHHRALAVAVAISVAGCVDLSVNDPNDPVVIPIDQVDFAEELGIDLNDFEERDGIWIRIDEEGDGAAAVMGDVVHVYYNGWVWNGVAFDAVQPPGNPMSFLLGAPGVMVGVVRGMIGMPVGETRTFLIPPPLGFGSQQAGVVPPNSWLVVTLTFERLGEEADDPL